MKPKIALIVDTDNWAFYNRAVVLKEKLSEYFDFTIIPYVTALDENLLQLILLVENYDLVHFFWRGVLFFLNEENIVFQRNNIDVNKLVCERFSKVVKTTCVPDHAFLEGEFCEENKKALDFVDDYYVMSKKLLKIYNKLGCKRPYGTIMGGANTDLFKPNNLERFDNLNNRKIIIGWTGNSKWGESGGKEDIKGVRTIIIPAIEQLQNEGYNIELKLADRNERFIPIEEMKDFYNSIDIYICASKEEGGPNTVLEAMCCGVPVISTNVGVVSEVFGKKQSEFLMEERSIEILKEKIKELIKDKNKFKEISLENMKEIEKYSYDEIAKQFKQFFEHNLKKRGNKDGKE